MFGFGPAEIFVLICLGLIFTSRKKLPDLAELLRSKRRRDPRSAAVRPWDARQWFVVGGILVVTTFLIALLAVR